ncbi:acyltransferase [Riemerella anatipestifer]|uniref:acyltransferase n=2 Tax=Riemerella anatipestifer TaxID=34085 RepID=UPI0021D5E058|nr:acyltransferase [Riemerella anatipestifer]MCU7539522.1 acyltransferase [Riemerella anatipestifer]MDY3525679.1 acyltransferase [Riemerella anatipestifer]
MSNYYKGDMTSFYSIEELKELPIKSFGENVLISRKVSLYGRDIEIGSNVRIDDYCILSGKIKLGSYIHIGAYCALYGAFGIEMEDFTGLSPRCTVFSATDDFGGNFLISPMTKKEHTRVSGGLVKIRRYSQIGAACVIMPDVEIAEGTAVGAMSLINKNTEDWSVYVGVPAAKIKKREKGLLDLIFNYE